jgi:hypothetical protein
MEAKDEDRPGVTVPLLSEKELDIFAQEAGPVAR